MTTISKKWTKDSIFSLLVFNLKELLTVGRILDKQLFR